MTVIKLRHPRQLGPAVRSLSRQFDNGVIKALRRTARYGATQAIKVSRTSRPYRPRASGTYERSFMVVKVPDGAVLTNSAKHSIFVELGRRPGKRPPLEPIVEWVRLKRLAKGDKARRVAVAVARKIGRKGTQGRYVFRRLMPVVAKRLQMEIATEMQRSISRAARGTKK